MAWLEARLNRPSAPEWQRGALGILTLVVMLSASAFGAFAFDRVLPDGPVGSGILILAASSLLAQRSLHQHVRAVAEALKTNGLTAGRAAVAMVVGRNPDRLDEAGVARAAIESLAENFSDGVVAPAFWLIVGGLPNAMCYKATNTADSMIGHRTPRFHAFGWAAARLDDVINLPASRLSALFLVLAAPAIGASPRGALQAVWRDARNHRSPNAGWPEAAMAGALGLQLAGPRVLRRHAYRRRIHGRWPSGGNSRRHNPGIAFVSRGLRGSVAGVARNRPYRASLSRWSRSISKAR